MMEDMIMGCFDYLDNALCSYVCLGIRDNIASLATYG